MEARGQLAGVNSLSITFYRDLVHQLSCKHSYSLSHPADPKKGEFNGRMLSFSELFTSIGSEVSCDDQGLHMNTQNKD